MRPKVAVAIFLAFELSSATSTTPHALVYRGPAACKGCPEAVAKLLRSSPTGFNVSYVGPNEPIDISRASLSTADLYAQPGGGGISETWPHMKPHYNEIREFVAGGGMYLGNCLGAYFAGRPGFDFLGPGLNTNEECVQPGAQVTSRKNTIIQVNWHFGAGELAGTTENDRWLFFQDGAVIAPHQGNVPNATVLARYSSTNDIAALVMDFGKGRVGIVGPHPEADKSWYTPHHIHNPDGIKFDLGWDLVESLVHGPQFKSPSSPPSPASTKSSDPKTNSGGPSISTVWATFLSGSYSVVLLAPLCLVLYL